MDTFVKHNFGLMICNFFNKVRFLTNKLKLLIFMKKPFLHLHLSLLFLMGCVFLLPSCIEDKAEDAAHRLVVSKVDVELIQTGMLNTGSKASFDVLANRGYVITSDAEWLDVDKPTGKGRVSVTLEAKAGLMVTSIAVLSFCNFPRAALQASPWGSWRASA